MQIGIISKGQRKKGKTTKKRKNNKKKKKKHKQKNNTKGEFNEFGGGCFILWSVSE